MKKHRRMLKLVIKLFMGHSTMFVERFATDFAEYRAGTTDLHPAILMAFKRFENNFGLAFKHRHLIERNHQLRTGIYGDTLLAIIKNLETPAGSPKRYYQDYHYPIQKPDQEFQFTVIPEPSSKTLH